MKKSIYFIFIVCLLFIGNTVLKNYVDDYDTRVVIEYYNANNLEISSIYEYSKDNNISTITLDDSLNNIDIYYISWDYLKFEKYQVIEGRTFIKEDELFQKQFIIVNKEYAIKEFASVDIIGNKATINNTEFEIIGVIENKYIHNKIFKNKPKIYLGQWNNNKKDKQYINILYDTLNFNNEKEIHKILEDININHLKETIRPLENLVVWNLKLINIIVFLRLLTIVIFIYKELKVDYYKNLKDIYLKNWMCKNKAELLKLALILVLLLICVYINQRLSIDINPVYIPETLISFEKIKQKIFQYIQINKDVTLYEKNIIYDIKILSYIPRFTSLYLVYKIITYISKKTYKSKASRPTS